MALFFFVCLLSVDGAQNSGEPGTAISNRTYHNVHSTAMCGKSQHVIRLLSWHTLLLYVDNAAISKSHINAPGVKPLLEGDIVSALLTYTLCRLYCEGEQLVEHPLTEKSKDWKLLAEQRLHSNRCRHCSGILTLNQKSASQKEINYINKKKNEQIKCPIKLYKINNLWINIVHNMDPCRPKSPQGIMAYSTAYRKYHLEMVRKGQAGAVSTLWFYYLSIARAENYWSFLHWLALLRIFGHDCISINPITRLYG